MRKFSIEIWIYSDIYYNHYLSDGFISTISTGDAFKKNYPLRYSSRRFDKPAIKWRDGVCFWKLDDKWNRVGRPAIIWYNGGVEYWENGEKVRHRK